jgi:nucleotide-binding universal stress UspA family protein
MSMRILVATDGSAAAERAVSFAAKLAKDVKGSLKICHVIALDNVPLDKIGNYALREHVTIGDVLNNFADEKVKTAVEHAKAAGVSEVETTTPIGDIAEAILETARDDKTDIIVVGKRGRGRLSGLVMGSVSQKVVSVAPCAVMVVP